MSGPFVSFDEVWSHVDGLVQGHELPCNIAPSILGA